MDEKIFRHYTQVELDRNYDQRAWAKNADDIFGNCARQNLLARADLPCHGNLAYGDGPDEILDWFPAERPDAPVLIWVHGGAWRNYTKDDFLFVAPAFVRHGVHVVLPNFSKAPAVRLVSMVDQIKRVIAWVGAHAQQFGADPQHMFIGGHSSGAHLVATSLLQDALSHDRPAPLFKAAFCVSGSYDLEAVMLSARSSYLIMAGTEEHDLSPARHLDRCATKVLVVYADGDTNEFQRHSREYAEALRKRDLLIDCVRLPGLNHFEINASLGDAGSPLFKLMAQEIEARSV